LLATTFALGTIAVLPLEPFAQTPEKGEKSGSGTGTLAEARVHMDKGQELFLTKKFAEAAVEFRTAYEIRPFSTFLFNEGVCHEKLKHWDDAIRLFQKYVDTDPNAPDRPQVLARIDRLKAEKAKDLGVDTDAGAATSGDAEPADGDAAPTTAPDAGTTPVPTAASLDEMRSIVVIESLPDGAPVEIWSKTDPAAAPFVIGGANTGWKKVSFGTTTMQQSLPLGTYHIVIPKFQDYRATETDVTVAAATISQFKANLAQGAFYGVLKIRSYDKADDGGEIRGEHVFVKKATDKKFVDRGVTPYEESLESGTYAVRVEQPGFLPMEKKVDIAHGTIDERKFELVRGDDGLIRVEVTGADKAEVFVDDGEIGTWQLGAKIEAKVKSGVHKLKVKADDRKTYKVEVDVPKGKMVVVHADLKPSVPRGAAWSTGIAAAVFLGGGIYLGLQSNKLHDELATSASSNRLDQEDPRIKRGQYFAIGADLCFAVGGIFALISTYNFIRDPLPNSKGYSEPARDFDALPSSPRPSVSFHFVPIASPSLAGFGILGEF